MSAPLLTRALIDAMAETVCLVRDTYRATLAALPPALAEVMPPTPDAEIRQTLARELREAGMPPGDVPEAVGTIMSAADRRAALEASQPLGSA